MKKYLVVFFFLIVFCLPSAAQDKKRIQRNTTDTDIVYIMSNDIYFHLGNCLKLSRGKTAVTAGTAKQRGLLPCPDCMFKEVAVEDNKEAPTNNNEGIKVVPRSSVSIIQTKGGFRKSSWGDTKEQVKKSESSEFIKSNKTNTGLDFFIFNGKAGEFDCLVAYYFAENLLVEGRYLFTSEHINKNLFIDDFNAVKSNLIQKYGNPQQDNKIWRNDLYKDDSSEWGTAISAGHLAFESKWILVDTEITLQLKGDNFEISFVLAYQSTSPVHRELIKKEENKAKKEIW